MPALATLWTCPKCGRAFANRNQTHTCGLHTLEAHFRASNPEVVQLYQQFEALVRRCGPVTVLPEKTRIAFQVRMSFAAVSLRKQWLDGHVVLARRLESPRFRKLETFSPRNHLHAFRLTSPNDLDEEVAAWLAEAYAVGAQHHLTRRATDLPST